MTIALNQLLGIGQNSQEDSIQSLVSKFLEDKKNQERDLGFGRRVDDTQKGLGFFGKIPVPGSKKDFATELAFTTKIAGKEELIPLIVPGLNKEQIDRLLSSEGLEGIEDIIRIAEDFATKRKKEGRPFFATEEEEGLTEFPESRKE